MTQPIMRRGDKVWRVGKRFPLKCTFVRPLPGGKVQIRISTFSDLSEARAEDVFTDRDECRAEIKRRIEEAMHE